jgi:hypothetical protein
MTFIRGQEEQMTEPDRWLSDYGASHADMGYPAIYWLAVAGVAIGTVGMLWALPVPAEFLRISPVLNWGSAYLMVAVVYYFIISLSLAIGMLPLVAGTAVTMLWLTHSPYSLGMVSASLFALSLGGLYLGQRQRGGLQAVFGDIQLMMIAPAWLLSRLYRRLGIPV